MSDTMEHLDQAMLATLRGMAQQGQSPSEMLRTVKRSLGAETHILTLLKYFRQAFGLTLADVKPIATLSRNEPRDVSDEALLNDLLLPAILNHRPDWDAAQSS